MTDYSFAEIGRPISLRVADGPPLEATLAEFAYRTDEAGGVSAEAVIEVSPADWSRVDSERLFHLEPDTRGPGAQNFAPQSPVRIDLQLSSMLVPLVFSASQEPSAAGRHLADLSADSNASPLLATESWYAQRVMSDVELPAGLSGELRSGFRTTWATEADEASEGDYANALGLPLLATVEEVLE